jgi:hypothetical protein
MDETRFWVIIEAGGRKALTDPERQLAAVHKQLLKLSPEEIRAFHRLFDQKLAEAYTWDLWGAAYLINGGCSDDGFYYFRAWLISRGERCMRPPLRTRTRSRASRTLSETITNSRSYGAPPSTPTRN